MLYTFAGQLPRHLYCFVDSTFLSTENHGFIPAIWFSLTSHPSRMWGCTVHLENGAIYRGLPPHAISFTDKPEPVWSKRDSQAWDCYGYQFTTIEYAYLQGLACKVKADEALLEGEYLFTAAPINDGYSAYPEQAKEFKFIKLTNGRLTVQPTNRVAFEDLSFTGTISELPKGLARQSTVWTCE